MTIESRIAIAAFDEQDNNPSANPSFDSVLAARLSRRSLLKGSMGLAAGAFFGGSLLGCNDDDDRKRTASRSGTSNAG